jgi:hypothetical protein
VEAAVVQLSRRRRILAPLALAVGAVAMLFQFPGLAGPWIARRCDDRQAGLGERPGRSASGR